MTIDRQQTADLLLYLLQFSVLLFVWFDLSVELMSMVEFLVVSLYLLFLPGVVLVRLVTDRSSFVLIVLFSVAISLAFTMILGVAVIVALDAAGMGQPLTGSSFLVCHVLFTAVANQVTRRRDRDVSLPRPPDRTEARTLVLLGTIFLLSFTGAYLNRVFQLNQVTICVLVLVAAGPVLVVLDGIPERLYPLTIYVMGVALLVSNSLYKPYIHGDANWAFYFATLTLENHYWLSGIQFKAASMLGISIFRPVFAMATDASLTTVYKYVSPFVFAFVPVVVYEISALLIDRKQSFFAAYFYISLWLFQIKLVNLYRQHLVMLFIALVVYLLLAVSSRETSRRFRWKPLLIVFTFGLVVTHYGSAYIFLALLLVTAVSAVLLQKVLKSLNVGTTDVDVGTYAALTVVLVFSWYTYTGGGNLLNSFSRIGSTILIDLTTLYISTGESSARYIVSSSYSPSYSVLKWLHYLMAGLIAVGYFLRVGDRLLDGTVESLWYHTAAGFAGLMLAFMLLFPSANPMDIARVYPLMLFWLAPFAILGLRSVVSTGFSLSSLGGSGRHVQVAIALFLAVFLMFNSGLAPELTGEYQYNNALASTGIDEADQNQRLDYYATTYSHKDVAGARWFDAHRSRTLDVYISRTGTLLFSYGEVPRFEFSNLPDGKAGNVRIINRGVRPNGTIQEKEGDNYYYLRETTREEGVIYRQWGIGKWATWDLDPLQRDLNNESKVYTNGGSAVWRTR